MKWVLEVHDSVLLQVDEQIVEPIQELVLEGMTEHTGMKLRIPILADAKVAKSWGDL